MSQIYRLDRDTLSSSPTSTDRKSPTQLNAHVAQDLNPPTTSCSPAQPLRRQTWPSPVAVHGKLGSGGDTAADFALHRTEKSSIAGNAEEEEKESVLSSSVSLVINQLLLDQTRHQRIIG